MSEELKTFTEWFDREVETGVRYSDNVTASLGPWSERREKFIRVIMQEAFFAAWNQRAKPVVKALVWEDDGFDQSWAETPFGDVSVQDYSNRTGWTMDIFGEDLGEKPTRNEAKRHVEKEVARRVLNCLEGYDD